MSYKGLQMLSTVTQDHCLELYLGEMELPEPGPDQVVVRVEAAPINPSDMFHMFSTCNPDTAKQTGTADRPALSLDLPAKPGGDIKARVGNAIALGNEGAGVVVAAGSSEAAQSLLDKTVGMAGGEMYSQYRLIDVRQCLGMEEGVTPVEAASSYVNPMTALSMVETLWASDHKALVHTTAASSLGQMLNRLCLAEGIGLVNVVRREEQEELLRSQGAEYVVNSSSESFHEELTEAIEKTGASLAFDATFGGSLISDILNCMEAAALRSSSSYAGYRGSDVHKQVYVYGGLNNRTVEIQPGFGFNWSIAGYTLTYFLQKASPETAARMRARVAKDIRTIFASNYSHQITFAEALSVDTFKGYARPATGNKFLILPQGTS